MLKTLDQIKNYPLCEIVDVPLFSYEIGQKSTFIQFPKEIKNLNLITSINRFPIHEFTIMYVCQIENVIQIEHSIVYDNIKYKAETLCFEINQIQKKNYFYKRNKEANYSLVFGNTDYFKLNNGQVQLQNRRTCRMETRFGFVNPFEVHYKKEIFSSIAIGSGRQSGLGVFNICAIDSSNFQFIYIKMNDD